MSPPTNHPFTGADGDPLDGNWTTEGGSFVINSNGAVCNNGSLSVARWNADSFNADQSSQVTMSAIGSSPYAGPAVRIATGANSYYGNFHRSSESILLKVVAGSGTQLGSNGAALSVSDLSKLTAVSDLITPYTNGSISDIGAQTDATLSTGSAGICGIIDGATTRLDDFVADNIGGGGGGTANPWYYYANQQALIGR